MLNLLKCEKVNVMKKSCPAEIEKNQPKLKRCSMCAHVTACVPLSAAIKIYVWNHVSISVCMEVFEVFRGHKLAIN